MAAWERYDAYCGPQLTRLRQALASCQCCAHSSASPTLCCFARLARLCCKGPKEYCTAAWVLRRAGIMRSKPMQPCCRALMHIRVARLAACRGLLRSRSKSSYDVRCMASAAASPPSSSQQHVHFAHPNDERLVIVGDELLRHGAGRPRVCAFGQTNMQQIWANVCPTLQQRVLSCPLESDGGSRGCAEGLCA